jgi:hypothetical protein
MAFQSGTFPVVFRPPEGVKKYSIVPLTLALSPEMGAMEKIRVNSLTVGEGAGGLISLNKAG